MDYICSLRACASCCCHSIALKVLLYLVLAVAAGDLIYCIVAIPKYRWVALILMVLALVFLFNLWRYFPCERRMMRKKAEALVEKRLNGLV